MSETGNPELPLEQFALVAGQFALVAGRRRDQG
jgi:hypothetical protein